MVRTTFSFAAVRYTLFVALAFTAAVQPVSAATPVPAITYKASPAPEKKVRGINDRIQETFYPTYIRSPKSVTAAGEWRAYVARVKFTLTEDNAVVRVHAGTTVLQANPAGVKITGGITVFNPDQNAINVDAQGNVTFGTAEGGVDRQGAKQVFEISVA
ncbi:MAG: hypothetical protein LBH00_07280, partial [Planctomycetaceae bacterium]|nr:hypothetical protein [Planctomycetaceae bacterium]